MTDAQRRSSLADGPERGLSRCRGSDLTRFAARDNDASSSEKMHRYTFHKRLKFTMKVSECDRIDFLDVTLIIENEVIKIDLYKKIYQDLHLPRQAFGLE